MFKNYHELFNGYVDLYSASLFGLPASRVPDASGELSRQFDFMHDFSFINGTTQRDQSIANDNQHQLQQQHRQHEFSSALKRLESSLLSLENYLLVGDQGAQGRLNSNTLEPNIGSRLIEEDGSVIMIGSFNKLKFNDAAHIICIFTILLLAKRLLVSKLAQSSWLRGRGLRHKDRERLDECLWRLTFYLFSSAWLIYTCFIRHKSHLLFSGSFVQYSFEVDWWSYTICMIETAFYLHATYALIWEDVWRRDSPMMLIHHLAAILSVFGLYVTRIHHIGLISTVLRDTCDVLLEVTKLIKCFYVQHGRRVKSLGLAIKFCLIIFTLAFAINQLYYYPLFCLYHGLNVIKVYQLQTPVMVSIATCGLLFLLLDCVWFLLILRLLYYIVLSGGKLKDIREYEDEDVAEIEDSFKGKILSTKNESCISHSLDDSAKYGGKAKSD